MDAIEKVLTNLMESMHKHMAKGHGAKKVEVSAELEKAGEVEEPKVEEKKEVKKELSAFDKFLMDSRPRNQDKRVSVHMRGPKTPSKEVKKKK